MCDYRWADLNPLVLESSPDFSVGYQTNLPDAAVYIQPYGDFGVSKCVIDVPATMLL
jgi:hypothetical protein